MSILARTIIILCFAGICESQVSQNMYLLRNLNQHSSAGLYSACWGYRAPNGREYAILGCWNGTAFIDITDSANIHEADFVPGLESCCREMKVFSNYAYITADGTANPSGVQVVNLSFLPDSVSLANTYFFTGFQKAHTIQQEGPYLYLNGGNYLNGGIAVLGLSVNPVNPVKRGEWETWYVHDCRVINDTIWACIILNNGSQGNGTITVINAMNKDSLRTINSWVNSPQPGPHNCALTTDHKYCLVADEINGDPRLMKIWNVQNLNNVIQVATWQPAGITTSIIHNIELYGNYVIAAHYTAGVRVVNVSNPSNPTEAGWYDTYPQDNSFTFNGCWGVYLFPSGKIIASDRQTGLYVLKTTFSLIGIEGNEKVPVQYSLKQNYPNPFNPSTTIEYTLPKSGYVTIKIYDVSGKQAAILADGFMTYGTHKVRYDAGSLATGIYFYRMEVKDASNPAVRTETKKMVYLK